MDSTSFDTQLTRRRRIFGVVAGSAVTLFVLYWLLGFSFIEVVVGNQGAGDLEYSISDQNRNGDPAITSTSLTTFRKLVRKGNFEVMVKQSDTSAFSVVSAKGFFRTTRVQVELKKERGREFVGGNPSPCMHMLKEALISYACGGPYGDTTLHVPASGNQATYNLLAATGRQGAVEGFVRTGGQEFVIIKNFLEINDENPAHAAYAVGDDLSLPVVGISLSALKGDELYTIVPYRQGFLAYNTHLTHAVYYPSVQDEPGVITLSPPNDQTFTPYLITASGDIIAAAYSKPSTGGRVSLDDPKTTAKTPSVVVVQSGNSAKQLSFGKRYSAVQICGQDRLCLLHDHRLEVHDISGNKPNKLFEVTSVNEFHFIGETLLAVKDEAILGIDASTGRGSVQYTFGQYSYCGIKPSGQDYLLCVINPKQKKAALLLSQAQNSDGIDQKIAGLLQLDEVMDISAYRNSLFISPNAGPISYQTSIRSYGYNPDTIKSASDKIDAEIDRLGIDRNRYRIVNTLR